MKKWFILGVLSCFAVFIWWLSCLLFFRPWNIRHFFEREFYKTVWDDPEMISQTRIFEEWGLSPFNDQWTDISDEAEERRWARKKETLKTLLEYDYNSLSDADKTSFDVLKWQLELELKNERFKYHSYPVNQLFGIQSDIPDFLINIHQVNNENDAEDYIARLNGVEKKVGQLIDILKIREEKKIIPPRFVLNRVIEEISNFTQAQPEEHILYTTFANKLKEPKAKIDAETQKILLEAAAASIQKAVTPSYQKLNAFLKAQLPKSTDDDGVWKLPTGTAYYDYRIAQNVTAPFSAERIHQIGLEEVARITGEMKAILISLGYKDTISVGPTMQLLARDPRFLYPNNDEGRKQCLADYTSIIEEVTKGMPQAFDVMPKAQVRVERIPVFKEKTSPGAYYNSPAMDGSRPGIFYAKLYDMNEVPKFGMRTLSYHEAVPGHHFQIAIQQELEDIPTFRKFMGFTAYVEGWALYAERLAWELGYQKDPYSNLGRLQDELFRAVRLVVDTGIHRYKWSREKAIDYMYKTTGMPYGDVVSEIERYIVMPGQACSYKMGMLKILALREQVKAQAKSKDWIKGFHNVLLRDGALPLTLLESRLVAEYRKQDK